MARYPLRVRTVLALGVFLAACANEASPPPITPFSMPRGGCVEDKGHTIERACVPRSVRESALVMEVEGCVNECSLIETCSVQVDGREIVLSLDGKTCDADCDMSCRPHKVTCTTPKLDPGKYLVRYGDGSGRVDLVEVGFDEGAAARCSL